MYTMHPTVLAGPADWDAARLPREEFDARLAALWRDCDPALGGIVVHGSPASHAELAYLTHFTPKLEAAIALIPRQGEPRLLVGGGANMLGAARPLTFIATLQPLRAADATIARLSAEVGPIAFINGDAMPYGLRQAIVAALGEQPPDATAVLVAAMRRKSPRELALIRDACASLDAGFRAMRLARHSAQSMTDVVLAGEAAAYGRGAQDVRTLVGSDGRLAPFTQLVDSSPVLPLQVYLAARHDGYWAEGFATMASPGRLMSHAAPTLDAAVGMIGPRVAHRAVAQYLDRSIGRAAMHPTVGESLGHSIGLALREPGPGLSAAREGCFSAGEVYTVRVTMNEGKSPRITSAMVAVTADGHDVLWRETGA
jgi:hypothetical protein